MAPLLDDAEAAAIAQAQNARAAKQAKARVASDGRSALARFEDDLKARLKTRFARTWSDPKKQKRAKLVAGVGIPVLLIAGAAAYWQFGMVHEPDYFDDDLGDVFDYTLLSSEFNQLPVKRRLELIQQLVQRLKGMSADDSVMMASFAAGIAGKAREQLMQNASLVMIDVFDQYAKKYDQVPEHEREAFINETFLDITKTAEAVMGINRNISDEERLADAKRQAEREKERVASRGAERSGTMTGRMFEFMNENVGGNADPVQRARSTKLMRDMARQFRGQDPDTGKPVPNRPK
ncbi:MAG: hypothetical protein SFZ23_10340 [Planctomycetota bacterium]|nr:hypothetical protein [Planctomycetota bacterium]